MRAICTRFTVSRFGEESLVDQGFGEGGSQILGECQRSLAICSPINLQAQRQL